jgi:GTP-binding protein Era
MDQLIEQPSQEFRSGFVAVVGRPNAGKSTLINRYVGQKVAIVSPKPQTTRKRLLGIVTTPEAQVLFVDTPGLTGPHHRLDERMMETVRRAIPDADVALFLVDLSVSPSRDDRQLAELLRNHPAAILALNKSDLVSEERWEEAAKPYRKLGKFSGEEFVSALEGGGTEALMNMVIAHLPLGPQYYPADQVTDKMEREIAAELIREQIMFHTHQEVPHAVAVEVDEFLEDEDPIYVSAIIYVEKNSQKGIIIGRKGALLRQIGEAARARIKTMMGANVHLELWVKVEPGWRRRGEFLKRLGY